MSVTSSRSKDPRASSTFDIFCVSFVMMSPPVSKAFSFPARLWSETTLDRSDFWSFFVSTRAPPPVNVVVNLYHSGYEFKVSLKYGKLPVRYSLRVEVVHSAIPGTKVFVSFSEQYRERHGY